MTALTIADLPPPPPGKMGWPWTEAGLSTPDRLYDDRPWPCFSIVTPSYNQGEFIEETIRSVLLQGYPNLEYIVQDGGSQDGSVEIIKKYEKWITNWSSRPDGGQSDAINQGFERATGHLLGWLNSDDVYLPGALQRIAKFFAMNPAASLVYGQAENISREGKSLGAATQVQAYDRNYLLAESNIIAQPAAFFLHDSFKAVGCLDTSLHIVMDWDLWLRMEAQGSIHCVPWTLAQMRLYPETKTYSSGRTLYREIRSMVERYGGHGLPTYFKSLLLSSHLKTALTAYSDSDWATAHNEVDFVVEVALPKTDDKCVLADEIADWVWTLASGYRNKQNCLVDFVEFVSEQLPGTELSRDLIRRRAKTLILETLSFENYVQGRFEISRNFAWKAIKADPQAWKNRGLQSIMVRSLWKSFARLNIE